MVFEAQRQLRLGRTKGFLAKRAIAAVTVAFFCFPASRFYFAIELNPIQCLDHRDTHAAPSADEHEHSHSAQSLPGNTDHGFFFQHCKDTYEGIGLTPVQPSGVPVAVSYQPPETPIPTLKAEPRQLVEADPSLPFHPPRHRA